MLPSMPDAVYATLAISAFVAAIVLLARLVSLTAAMVNLGTVALLAVALVLHTALNSPAIAYVAFALAAASFVLRWAVNSGMWIRNRRRDRQRAP